MNRLLAFGAALLLGVVSQSAMALSAEDEMRQDFQAIVDGLNDNTFSKFADAVDSQAMLDRIFGTRVIDPEVKQTFAATFSGNLESMFVSAFPRPRSEAEQGGEIIGTIIFFEAQNGQGRAIVRYEGKGYRFSYHSYELAGGSRGRVEIVDWFDYYNSTWFSENAGNSLVQAMPDQQTVRSVLATTNPTEGQLFQIGEFLKALRDRNPVRYFQIYDGLEEPLRREPYVVTQNYQYCRELRDPGRLDNAVKDLVANFPGEALYSLGLSEYYISKRRFEEAIAELDRFEGALGKKDGVSESFKATSAMALGDFERAETFAVSATQVEPGLELSWWTLLRARTAGKNYGGATEVLTQLEDRFGHLLIPQKLRRDRFLKILIEQEEYKVWREQRDKS